MCGRYTLKATTQDILERFAVQLALFQVEPRYNIAPSQTVPTVILSPERTLEGLTWGLVPFWAKDPKKVKPMINARVETLAEKPSFKTALSRRRCLIPADGFYEWKTDPSGKSPIHFRLKSGGLFAFAGLFDERKDEAGESKRTCTIITVPAHGWLEEVHDRMPAILAPENESLWLDPKLTAADDVLRLLPPYPARLIEGSPVSRMVNSPKIDRPECLNPATE